MNSEYFSKRFEAVFLHLHPKGPKLPIAKVASQIKKSKAFVQKWVEQWKREKNVNDLPNGKPNRASTSKEEKAMVNLFDKNPGLSLREGVERLKHVLSDRKLMSRRRLCERDCARKH